MFAMGISAEDSQYQPSFDPTDRNANYGAVLYDNTNGLPTSEANDITQTSDGALWIGSYSGLIRFDGSHFERMDSTVGITSVTTLHADSRDRIWIGTNDNGVVLFYNNGLVKYGIEDGLRSISIRSIVEDHSGNIYVGTTKGIVGFTPDGTLVDIDSADINDAYIRQLVVGEDNVVYGITLNGSVVTLSDLAVTSFHSHTELADDGANIRSILPDSDNPGYVYLGDEHSEIYHVKLGEKIDIAHSLPVAPLAHVNSIDRIGDKLWICSDDGIGVMDIATRHLSVISNIPMQNSIENMMIDYQGNYWFTSSRQGLMKIVPNQFVDVFSRCNVEPSVVNTTCLYDGKLFVGTDTGLVVISGGKQLHDLPFDHARKASGEDLDWFDLIQVLKGVKIRSIVKDNEGNMWISTFGSQGLLCFDGRELVCYDMDSGMPSERVRTVIELSDGSYAVACTGGVVRINDGAITDIYDRDRGISINEVLTVCEAKNGDILVGTDGGGLDVISPDGSIRHIGVSDGLSSEVIMRIKADSTENVYWLVTSNSISYLDSDYNVHTVSNFTYSNNFDLYENRTGYLWVLSSNGIYVVPKSELFANETISPVFYNMDNGMSCITTSNSYSEITDSGDLYISGTTGVSRVNVNSKMVDVLSLKMNVPYIEADGELLFAGEDGSFRIDSSVQRITIYPFVYTYSLVNPQISYRLDGQEAEGTTASCSDLSPVVFTNLKGGEYSFEMKLTNPAGAYESDYAVKIVKEKAFHEYVAFYIIIALMVIGVVALLVSLIFRGQIRKYEKRAEENKKLIREITEAFAKTIDMKDKYTNGHSSRVAEYTVKLARELGYDEETLEKYRNIALLHDIGKIGIPMEVLNKNGKLTDEEYACIKSHTTLGHDVLNGISIMPELSIGAGSHHERPDGKGYPEGLKGDEIPRVAQIIAVADTFDAMYSDRPYRKRMNFDKAVSIIKDVSGTQLTADVVDAFLRLVDKGEFRAPDDVGGGTFDDINNIHKKFDEGGKS